MSAEDYRFARRTHRMKASIIREILKVTARPEMISFAGGLPAPDTFPLHEFGSALQATLETDGPRCLQYSVSEGHPGLKEFLCQWFSNQGIRVMPDEMVLTNGSQQGLDLLGKILLDPGDKIVVENPTYLGALQAFNAYEPDYVTVRLDDDGVDLAAFQAALAASCPKFIYLVPTFQNPSGVSTSLAKREKIVQMAHDAQVPIIEDDPYSRLRFHGAHLPSLYSIAGGKGVVFLSTFSKILSPGIRLGIMIGDKEVIRQIVLAKQGADLQTNTLVQHAVYHYCKNGSLDRHIPRIIENYGKKALVMLQAIEEHFPKSVSITQPDGGMFVWCRLPEGTSARVLFQRAVEQKVAFVEGSVFYANGGGENTFRLNFTNSSHEAIDTGVRRLAMAMRETCTLTPEPHHR